VGYACSDPDNGLFPAVPNTCTFKRCRTAFIGHTSNLRRISEGAGSLFLAC